MKSYELESVNIVPRHFIKRLRFPSQRPNWLWVAQNLVLNELPRIKLPEREADRSPAISAKVNNYVTLFFHFPTCFQSLVLI